MSSLEIRASSIPTHPVVAAVCINPTQAPQERQPKHLALLLDVSGSMDYDNRLENLKRTLHLLVDSMPDGDLLTLIKYSSKAYILKNASPVNGTTRPDFHTEIDRLVALDGTNMESAFLALRSIEGVDSVFVLTDGQLNEGVTSASGLLSIVRPILSNGTPINTLGYGDDHNANLLKSMAVRSCGSYTYADASELLPAIIGDILGGLASEVGRKGRLHLPDGWTCMELGASLDSNTYTVGTLIHNKPQWIVLQGPLTETTVTPSFVFEWSGGPAQTIVLDDTVDPNEIHEQHLRCKVAHAFETVGAHMESQSYGRAQMCLKDLVTVLDASPAKDRTLVVQLRAQVEDMLQTLAHLVQPTRRGSFGDSATRVLNRLASNSAALGVQRGFLSQTPLHATDDDNPSNLPHSMTPRVSNPFSSPAQRRTTQRMTSTYSQQSTQ